MIQWCDIHNRKEFLKVKIGQHNFKKLLEGLLEDKVEEIFQKINPDGGRQGRNYKEIG